MKRLLSILAAITALCVPSRAANQAEVHLYCLSLRFQPASTKMLGLSYTLTLTTDSPGNMPGNGELAPLPGGDPSSHASFYRLDGDILFEPGFGTMAINIPPATDANANGIDDFFEVSQAVSGSTTGLFSDQYRNGKVTTVWDRAANSKNGTCKVTLSNYELTFIHTFEIQEFSGPLSYTSLSTNVTGTVLLTKQGETTKRLGGRMEFDRSNPDQLGLRLGTWTNETRRVLAFDPIERLDRTGNHFTSLFFFDDGDLNTSLEDYILWLIDVVDPNDANRNGIPDISEDPIAPQPKLSITRSQTNVLLSVSGQVGKVHEIQRTSIIPSTNWTLVTAITLTNDPQVLSLSDPTNKVSFWRVKAQ